MSFGVSKDHLMFKLIFLIPLNPFILLISILSSSFSLHPYRYLPLSFHPSFTMSTNTILEKDYKHNMTLFLEFWNEKLMHPTMLMVYSRFLCQSNQQRKQEELDAMESKTTYEVMRLTIPNILNKILLTMLNILVCV